jgi:hypothetical protein
MSHWWKIFSCLLIGLLVAGCADTIVYQPTPQSAPTLSYLAAKQAVDQLWQKNAPHQWPSNPRQTTTVKFRKDTIELYATGDDGCVSTWRLFIKSDPYVMNYFIDPNYWVWTDAGGVMLRCQSYGYGYLRNGVFFDDRSEATAFANAIYSYKNTAVAGQRAAEAAFSEGAKKYREMATKLALPEDVQRFRIMAEDAFRNKDFKKAAWYYEQGLEIEPLWPQGQYNAALLCAEIQDYASAALHMKRYLELVPDAPNAKVAREKMYFWEGKAKEGETR